MLLRSSTAEKQGSNSPERIYVDNTLPIIILWKSALLEETRTHFSPEMDFIVPKFSLCNLATFFLRQGAVLKYILKCKSPWILSSFLFPCIQKHVVDRQTDYGFFLHDSREANYFQAILPFPICHCCLIDGLCLMRQKNSRESSKGFIQ